MNYHIRGSVLITTAFLLGFTFAGKNSVRNGDFEKFNGNEPVGWETTNLGKMLTVVTPSLKAHMGTRAVRCEVKTSFGSPMPGMITQKSIPLDGELLQLSLYYVLTSVGKDAGWVAVDFQSDEGSTVGIWQHALTSLSSDFTLFRVVTRKPVTATHGELRVTLMPDKEGGRLHDGSNILIDDIEFVPLTSPKDGPVP